VSFLSSCLSPLFLLSFPSVISKLSVCCLSSYIPRSFHPSLRGIAPHACSLTMYSSSISFPLPSLLPYLATSNAEQSRGAQGGKTPPRYLDFQLSMTCLSIYLSVDVSTSFFFQFRAGRCCCCCCCIRASERNEIIKKMKPVLCVC
jgi:hypothetical protein